MLKGQNLPDTLTLICILSTYIISDKNVRMANSDSDANGNFSLVEEGPLRDSVGGNQIATSLNNSFFADTHDFAPGKF